MSKRLTIELSEDATARYLELSGARTAAELSEDCEPSGPSLRIDIHPVYGCEVGFQRGGTYIDIGEARCNLLDVDG